jgi:hypothetical protein
MEALFSRLAITFGCGGICSETQAAKNIEEAVKADLKHQPSS